MVSWFACGRRAAESKELVSGKRRKVPKISPVDKQRLLHELDAWCRRERHGRLTWARLEEMSGFTRQALSSHPDVVERYGEAKAINRPDKNARSASRPETANQRVLDLQREIERLKSIISRYDERWARYARNASLLGYDLERLDEPIDPPARTMVRAHRRSRSV